MPPLNLDRRHQLADAAIALLGEHGVHGLSHRSADERAGLPTGTASNYFRTRDALLVAAAERITQLHLDEMALLERTGDPSVQPQPTPAPPEPPLPQQPPPAPLPPMDESGLIEAITQSLVAAATTHRTRYRAVCELMLEAARRPPLAEALDQLEATALGFTTLLHRRLGLATTDPQIRMLTTLYAGILFELVTRPAEVQTAQVAELARAAVKGALALT